MIEKKKDIDYYSSSQLSKLSTEERGKNNLVRIKIEGNFINGLKNGKWITIRKQYNPVDKKYVLVDSCLFNYKNGYWDGKVSYVNFSITGKLRKKEEAIYNLGQIQSATVYHYGYLYEKYESFYNAGKPTGIWEEKRNNGVYYLKFNKDKTYLKNYQTGFIEDQKKIYSVYTNRIPFEHGFENKHEQKIGGFWVGELNGTNARKSIINQIDK